MQPIVEQIAINSVAWGVLFFYFTRSTKKRDEFEKDALKRFEDLTLNLTKAVADFDKRLALAEQGIGHSSQLGGLISALSDNVAKLQNDLRVYYKRLREVESGKTN
jgi:hypothetical protein